MTNLIGLTGRSRSGKDSVAEILADEYGYTRVAFADAIKRVLERLDPQMGNPVGARLSDELEDHEGWEGLKQNPEVRRLLQNMGDAVRMFDPFFWIKTACIPNQSLYRLVVTDVRTHQEAKEILRKGGIIWRVVRPGLNTRDQHFTETALDDWEFPVIENSGTLEQLQVRVREMMTTCTP